MCLHFLRVSKEIWRKQTLPGFSESHILVRVAIATSSQTQSLFFQVRHCSEDFTYIISHSILSKPQWPGYYPYYINEEMVEGRSWRVNPRVPSFQRAYRELRTAVQLLQILSPMAWLLWEKSIIPCCVITKPVESSTVRACISLWKEKVVRANCLVCHAGNHCGNSAHTAVPWMLGRERLIDSLRSLHPTR